MNYFMDFKGWTGFLLSLGSWQGRLMPGKPQAGSRCFPWSGLDIDCLSKRKVTCLAEGVVEVLAHQAYPVVILIDLRRRGFLVGAFGHLR